jgi:hypothetical protein
VNISILKEVAMENIRPKAGEVIPWEIHEKEYEKILGDKELLKQQWQNIEVIAFRFIWSILTDF